MRSVKARSNDSVEDISRRNYGSSLYAQSIIEANPNVDFNRLQDGQVVVLPSSSRIDTTHSLDVNDDDVVIHINNRTYVVWDNFSLKTNFGTLADMFSFRVPFFPDDAEQRETFRPFSYKTVIIYFGQTKMFTGTMINIEPTLDSSNEVLVSGYGRCGILGDVTFSPKQYPIEYNEASLLTITENALRPFGLSVSFTEAAKSSVSAVNTSSAFSRVIAEPTANIASFLNKLASKQGVVLHSDRDGNVLYDKASKGKAVFEIIEGTPPLLKATASYNGQKRYSHLTALSQEWHGSVHDKLTVTDKEAIKRGIFRPYTILPKDVDDGQLNTILSSQMGRNLSDAAPMSITVSTWHKPDGNVFVKNESMFLIAPSIMIYRKTELFISGVSYERSSNSNIAVLSLSLPESFGGKEQIRPWEEA